jgi:membrane-associated HD superfamily phosphohydrolase
MLLCCLARRFCLIPWCWSWFLHCHGVFLLFDLRVLKEVWRDRFRTVSVRRMSRNVLYCSTSTYQVYEVLVVSVCHGESSFLSPSKPPATLLLCEIELGIPVFSVISDGSGSRVGRIVTSSLFLSFCKSSLILVLTQQETYFWVRNYQFSLIFEFGKLSW